MLASCECLSDRVTHAQLFCYHFQDWGIHAVCLARVQDEWMVDELSTKRKDEIKNWIGVNDAQTWKRDQDPMGGTSLVAE